MHSIHEIISDIKQGKIVVLVDDENRENEGDLIMAADFVNAESINFMATKARGLICLSLTTEHVEQLQLPLMVSEDQNHTPNKTAFTVSIEASRGVSTGISAADRAHTIRVASHMKALPTDIHTPGHIFPIRAQKGGVLRRPGHTEASVDLCRLAGLTPAAVICEVMNEDGTMARVQDLEKFCKLHDIKMGTILDLISYRLANESLVELVHEKTFQENSDLKLKLFRSKIDQAEFFVVIKGEISGDKVVPVRMHSDLSVWEVQRFLEKGETALNLSMNFLTQLNFGVFVFLKSPQKNWESLFHSQTPEIDSLDYGLGAQVLRELGLKKIALITSKPDRKKGIEAFGLEIVNTMDLET